MILIAGPCVIEKEIMEESAQWLCNAIEGKDIDFYFKSSAIKDNRTNTNNYYGIGMEEGISILQEIRKRYDVKITTDFHNEQDIYTYGKDVDLIQIPAYLAMQTSMIKAAAEVGTKVNFKKPQFTGPLEALNILSKYYDFGGLFPMITDRGTMLGYNQTFMDPRHIPILGQASREVIVDTTHPNKNYPGWENRNRFLYTQILARSYIAAGAKGVFIETHPNLQQAKCDGQTMYPLQNISDFIQDIYDLYRFMNK